MRSRRPQQPGDTDTLEIRGFVLEDATQDDVEVVRNGGRQRAVAPTVSLAERGAVRKQPLDLTWVVAVYGLHECRPTLDVAMVDVGTHTQQRFQQPWLIVQRRRVSHCCLVPRVLLRDVGAGGKEQLHAVWGARACRELQRRGAIEGAEIWVGAVGEEQLD